MKKLVFAVILAVLFASCADDTGGGSGGSGGTGSGFIYIGGSYMDSGVEKACYWVDGKRHELNGTSVENITVVGNAVYAAGYYKDGGVDKACYWVNGTRRDLPGFYYLYDLRNPFPNISVDRGNVYICGIYGSSEDNAKTAYWVNGIRRDPPANGIMYGVYAANGSVYIVGSYTDNGIVKPCYWINGSRIELPNIAAGSPDLIVGTITVADNRIYITCAFAVFNAAGIVSDIYSSYWIDGVQQKIIFNEFAEALAVSEGDVYMASGSGIYKNGESLTSDYGASRSAGLAVSSGKVYTCGRDREYINGDYVYTACYWVDGEQFFLDGARANAIFVKE
jgi:hypothetical protein